MENKWRKVPIGKFEGRSIYIELEPDITGQQENRLVERARRFIERSYRYLDFIDDMKYVLELE